ncbi:MAG TPA: FKBP-type peptidyl-prolyl cis-trans isomerase [Chthonomonadaceae bacterium]|nr:FKBP-type peptidyl-prolyl cis-trans isomerase [Chthonomonadaceae bacterium]
MRKTELVLAIAGLLGLGLACNPEPQKPAEGAPPPGADAAKTSTTTSAPMTAGNTAPAVKSTIGPAPTGGKPAAAAGAPSGGKAAANETSAKPGAGKPAGAAGTAKAAAPAGLVGKEIVTPTGLHYIDEKIGTGAVAAPGKFVIVQYTGTLLNGAKFDSSYDHPGKEPFMFTLGGGTVIAGWDEGIAGMRVGGKRKLIVPPNLGYKDKEQPGIPPNSTLKFDVELVDME